jgi:ATP-binding cassette, subfamily C (CFTR/MRP), member 4
VILDEATATVDLKTE